ncbi:MAG TPA: macrolide ABC transporter ATP-binding protein [Planctomycetes bacterium]|nr:macrolide ABC transporter ATP-binding protein [Planctomycetota bacterium]
MEPVAELQAVSRLYRMGDTEVRALDEISVAFNRGEFWSIMGSSGSGKSTLLNLLGCIDRPTSGTYLVGGRDTRDLDDDSLSELRGADIGFIFQSFNLIPQLNVLENIMVPLFYQEKPSLDGEESARSLAERVGLADRMSHRPSELSGGQQQRVAIARSLVNDPNILLADEATGNLDTHTSGEILDLFREFNEEGKTILLVTHEEEIGCQAHHVLRLKDGKIDEIGQGVG